MTYICENNKVRLTGNDKILGTVITMNSQVMAIQKVAANGVTYIPTRMVSVISYKGGR